MAGAGGVEVGRVSIRVVPNLDKFREDLKKGLEKETKGLKAEVDVVPNMAGFRARVAAATKGMRASVDVDANVDRKGIRSGIFGDVDRSSGSALRNLRDFTQAYNDSVRWMRQSHPDLSRTAAGFRVLGENARQHIDPLRNSLRGLRRTSDETKGSLRDFPSAFRDSVRWMRQANPEMGRAGASMRVLRTNAEHARDSVRKSMQGIRESTRNAINDPGSNKFTRVGMAAANAAKRVVGSMRQMRDSDNDSGDGKSFLSRFLRDSNKAGDAAEFNGRKIMGMTRVGWIVTAVFALAAPAIGLVGSLLAGIPSLLAAAGVAAGVVALGWDGIKKAAQTMTPAIDKLKESISGVFEERLTPVFEKLSGALPQLEGGLKNVANGMSDMFSGITDTVTSAAGMENLNTILDGTAKLFRDMTPGMKDFTEGFLNISAAGANSFSHLSNMVNDFAAQFKNSVAGVIKDGSFDSAMQGMSVAIGSLLSQLDRLVVAGVHVMGSMGQPMANFFQGFGDLIVGMLPGLASFSNMLFNTLGALGTQLGTVFQTLTPALTSVFDTLSQVGVGLMNALGPALNQVAAALGPVIQGMMGALAPVISQLMPIISNIAQQLGSVFAGVLTALGPSLNSLIGSFGQVAGVIGGAFSQALNVVGPILPQIASSIGQVAAVLGTAFAQVVTALAPILPVLAQAFAQMAQVIADVLLQAVTAIAPFLPMLAEAITQVVVAITPLLPIVVQAAASLITGLLPAVVSLMPTIVSLAQIIANVVTAIAPWIQALFQLIAVIIQVAAAIVGFLLSALGTLISMFMSLVSTVVSVAAGIVAAVGNFVSGVVGFISGLVSSITSTWTDFWNSLMQICAELLGNIVSAVGEFPGKVLGVLGNLGSILVNAGKALMDGLLSGITSGLQKVLDFASGIADKIASVKGPLPYDRKVLIKNGEALMEGLRKGIENGFAPIVDDASNMAGEIKDGVEEGTASKKLEQSGFSYMESLKFGLQRGVNDILSYFKDALSGMGDDLGVDGLYDKVVKAITEDAKLQEVPLNFVVGNADQLMKDLGFGSGAVPTLIDQLLNYDPTQDARDAADKSKDKDGGQGQTHIHYHVEDVNEALDMEEARRQRELLQHG
ncbi:tail length tape measure protein [Rhodococcus phage RER2]|uniref:Tape measure protein n=1 Tax=Rhodococcus phage RER2 TaxID=1109715 RepID=G9FHR3_9CAUD|nr:tail length tape measure protein [Rhodococcus phage RER2]AEV52159.1 tape measure protein [Rhodococcus phage RER2]